MAKKHKATECPRCNAESGSGRWMLTYLDMVTLLFGVFIIMYAMSKPDAKKAEEVAAALKQGFGSGGMTTTRGKSEGGVTPISNLKPQGTQAEIPKFTIHQNVLQQLQSKNVAVNETETGYHLVLTGDAFFAPGQWKLDMEKNREVLQLIALVGDAMPDTYRMEVVGNTDDTPVGASGSAGGVIETNWELSTLRAASVVTALQRYGVTPGKMKATGKAEFNAMVPNTNNENRAQNRRVDIFITGEGGKLKATVEQESGREIRLLSGGMSPVQPEASGAEGGQGGEAAAEAAPAEGGGGE